MCERAALLEQLFGYQVRNSGYLDAIDQTSNRRTRPLYTPSNPYTFNQELGFNGFSYGLDVRSVLALYNQGGYGGILPIAEQPRVNPPYPYDVRVVV